MPNYGKIARLPHDIREQLNIHLWNSEDPKKILDWLNSLPEVRLVLARHFQNHPITEQNLSEYKIHGPYRDWALRWKARQFSDNLQDKEGLGDEKLASLSAQQLAHWVVLKYSAIAEDLPAADSNPQLHLATIRQLCTDISRINHDEIQREKLRIELERLALRKLQIETATEQAHWEWTKRPDVRAKLYRGLAPDTMALIDRDRGVTPNPPPPPPPPPPPDNPARQDNPNPAP